MRDILPKPFTTLFDTFLNDAVYTPEQANAFRPQAEISETQSDYKLRLALPGFKKENIQISLEGNKLSISGEVRTENVEKKAESNNTRKKGAEESENKTETAVRENIKFYLREIRTGNFTRSFSLPKNADTENIEASFEDGILSLLIPKSQTKAMGKTIEIR